MRASVGSTTTFKRSVKKGLFSACTCGSMTPHRRLGDGSMLGSVQGLKPQAAKQDDSIMKQAQHTHIFLFSPPPFLKRCSKHAERFAAALPA